ncbi:MAG: thioredoxin family protein [Armatimonadota bacterium]
MVELRVFGKDFRNEEYEKMREAAEAVAQHYEGKVSVVEYDFRSEEANELGIARCPALSVNDRVVAVGVTPQVGSLIIKVGDALAEAAHSADE